VSWGLAAVVAPLAGTQLLSLGGPPLVWSVLASACLALAFAQPVVRRRVTRRLNPPLVELVETTAPPGWSSLSKLSGRARELREIPLWTT
jgi:hypothetical protein